MRRTLAAVQPAHTAGTLAIIFNGGLDIDGWTEHQQDAKDDGYDKEADDGSASWVANSLPQNLVEETVRLSIISEAPRAVNEAALGHPDGKGKRGKRDDCDHEAKDSDAERPAVVNPHQGRHE